MIHLDIWKDLRIYNFIFRNLDKDCKIIVLKDLSHGFLSLAFKIQYLNYIYGIPECFTVIDLVGTYIK